MLNNTGTTQVKGHWRDGVWVEPYERGGCSDSDSQQNPSQGNSPKNDDMWSLQNLPNGKFLTDYYNNYHNGPLFQQQGVVLLDPVSGQGGRAHDLNSVRVGLKYLGKYDEPFGKVCGFEFMDSELSKSIRSFQVENGLTVDGRINPDGETIRALNKKIFQKRENEKTPLSAQRELTSAPLYRIGGGNYTSPTETGEKREDPDRKDRGDFNVLRTKKDGTTYNHKGSDRKASFGDDALSPVSGKVVRTDGFPYRDDEDFKITTIEDSNGLLHDLFYTKANSSIKEGMMVGKGQLVGTVQDVSKKHNNTPDHLHYQIRKKKMPGDEKDSRYAGLPTTNVDGVDYWCLDPEPYLTNKDTKDGKTYRWLDETTYLNYRKLEHSPLERESFPNSRPKK